MNLDHTNAILKGNDVTKEYHSASDELFSEKFYWKNY